MLVPAESDLVYPSLFTSVAHFFQRWKKESNPIFTRCFQREKTGDKALKAMRVSRFIVFILISFFFLELIVEMF